MKIYSEGLLIALILSLLITPIVRALAIKLKLFDVPSERKVHKSPVPRLGGIAIYISFSAGLLFIVTLYGLQVENVLWGVLLGGGIMTIVGLIDDIYNLSPIYKIVGQFTSAFALMQFDIGVQFIHLPGSSSLWDVGVLSFPLTVLWVIGITNAINLIDGLDGLAAGVSAISSFAFFLVSISMGNFGLAIITLVLLGAILGFLKYNFYPANIFMGDSGAMFLGFTLAALSLLELKQVTVVSFLVPIFILAIPISDTVYAIVRRKMYKKPLLKADKLHLHHCLLCLGLSHRGTVLVIYSISAFFSILGIALPHISLRLSVIFLMSYVILLQLIAEISGMFLMEHRPLTMLWQKIKGIHPSK